MFKDKPVPLLLQAYTTVVILSTSLAPPTWVPHPSQKLTHVVTLKVRFPSSYYIIIPNILVNAKASASLSLHKELTNVCVLSFDAISIFFFMRFKATHSNLKGGRDNAPSRRKVPASFGLSHLWSLQRSFAYGIWRLGLSADGLADVPRWHLGF